MVRRVLNRKALGTVCLAVGTFLNPLGFDVLVYKLMEWLKDYWTTMWVLYCFAALFFGLSFLFYKLKKRLVANTFITLGFFVNPFGYDLVVYGINKITGSYWLTMAIMYAMAILFFALFAYLYQVNIIEILRHKTKRVYNNIKTNIKYGK